MCQERQEAATYHDDAVIRLPWKLVPTDASPYRDLELRVKLGKESDKPDTSSFRRLGS
jgi:hypothetical protein